MLTLPNCLHIPVLYEDSRAKITWGNAEKAATYQVDGVFDEDFLTAEKGRPWMALDAAEKTWAEVETEALSWNVREALPAQGLTWQNIAFCSMSWEQIEAKELAWNDIAMQPACFTVFEGVGAPCRAPDQGITWRQFESAENTWAQAEMKGATWQQLDYRDSVGLTWSQMDSTAMNWTAIEQAQNTWLQWERQPTRGFMWESIDAHFLLWDAFAAVQLSWDMLERLPPDSQTHSACILEIPLYKKSAMLRIRSFDGVSYSPYLIASQKAIHPRSLAAYKPPCLHLPAVIYEDGLAQIIWGELYAASGYELERRLGNGAYATVYGGPGTPIAPPAECDAWKKLWYTPDCKQHLTFTDTIPLYEHTTVQYRIRGYNSTDCSQYLESLPTAVTPVFCRDDSIEIAVVSGVGYVVQLSAKDIQGFGDVVMTVTYSGEQLRVDSFDVEAPTTTTDADDELYQSNAEVVSQVPGELRLRCIKPIASATAWGGVVLTIGVTALYTGVTKLVLK